MEPTEVREAGPLRDILMLWVAVGVDNVNEAIDQMLRIVGRYEDTWPDAVRRLTKAKERTGDGHILVVLHGDKQTNEKFVFEVTKGRYQAPLHRHGDNPDFDYGEKIWTLEGEITDVDQDQNAKTFGSEDRDYTHGPGSVHTPLIKTWWVGIFHQPAGSELV